MFAEIDQHQDVHEVFSFILGILNVWNGLKFHQDPGLEWNLEKVVQVHIHLLMYVVGHN